MKDELIQLIEECNDFEILKIVYQFLLNLKEQS